MKKISVNASGKYDILISSGILCEAGKLIKETLPSTKAFILCDTNVAPLYLNTVKASLEQNGYEVFSHVYPAGEESKRLSTVESILSDMAQAKLSRKDIAIALGGGVCGDVCGFCAAIYMRGIKFVQIPTSLLAMVDSSVGGKTAVDMPEGKNLVGAFHQPSLVICDVDVLKTLPDKYMRDGMAEVIKYGCICDKELFEILEARTSSNLYDGIDEIVARSVDTKRKFVEEDEFESGPRMALNFGHTFGHSLEKSYNFKDISHGEAVGIGMVIAAKGGEQNGETAVGTSDRLASLLNKYSLPVCDPKYGVKELFDGIKHDKKAGSGNINFVLISEIGNYFIKKMNLDSCAAKYFGV